MKRGFFLFVFAISLFGGLSSLRAEEDLSSDTNPTQFDDTRDVPRGLYMGIGGGYWYFTDSDDRFLFGDAWVTSLKLGYDIFKYLGVEVQYRFSGHQNSSAGVASRTIPQSHWSHQVLGIVRGMYPISRRWTVSLDAGGGLWLTRPNIKPTITQDARGLGTVGLGVQYFTRITGVVIGLDPTASLGTDLNSPVIQASGYIRYTF